MMGSLARRYAKALLQLAQDSKNAERMGFELSRLVSLYQEHSELRETLENRIFSLTERRRVLEAVCQKLLLSPVLQHVVLLLLERERIAYLPEIERELRRLVDDRLQRVRVRIFSAQAIDLTAELRVQAALEKALGKKIRIEKIEDSEMLGGLRIQVGDVIYDGSVLAQLEQVRHGLMNQFLMNAKGE